MLAIRRFVLALALSIVGLSLCQIASFAQGAKGSKSALTPIQLLQTGRYSEALPRLKQMAQAQPRDPSVQYYLGVAASGARDYDLAELAFSRVVVGSSINSPFVATARQQLARLPHRYYPQCCLQNDKTHRWSPSAYPVRIFISDGRTVPGFAGGVMSQGEYKTVETTVKTRYSSMPRSATYKSEYSQYVRDGLRAWDWAVAGKLLSYTIVTDPTKADIVVLFCETCKNDEAGFAVYPWVYKQPEIVWMACSKYSDVEHGDIRSIMARTAAHEFGHCWGLQHSQVQSDLMFATSMFEAGKIPQAVCSPNDRISLSALYAMPADINYIPVE